MNRRSNNNRNKPATTSMSPSYSHPDTERVPYTERDILLKRGGIVSQRQANKCYHKFLKANVMVYKSLPKDLRTHFAINIFLFLDNVCNRKLVQYRTETDDYINLTRDTAAPAVSAAIRDDRVAQACCSGNPLWILGLHHHIANNDSNKSNGDDDQLPYVCMHEGTFHQPSSMEELQRFLINHGLQNMLILPPDFEWPESLARARREVAEEWVDAADNMLQELEGSLDNNNNNSPHNIDGTSSSSSAAMQSETTGYNGRNVTMVGNEQPQLTSELPEVTTSAFSMDQQQSIGCLNEPRIFHRAVNESVTINNSNTAAPTVLATEEDNINSTHHSSSGFSRVSLLRAAALRRSCSTISLSDVENGDDMMLDENFEGFEFSKPDLAQYLPSNDPRMFISDLELHTSSFEF